MIGRPVVVSVLYGTTFTLPFGAGADGLAATATATLPIVRGRGVTAGLSAAAVVDDAAALPTDGLAATGLTTAGVGTGVVTGLTGFAIGAVLVAGAAAGFLTATGLAAGFLATAGFGAGFLAAGVFAMTFFAMGFFATGFLAAGFFATVFLTGLAADFFATGFFVATFFATGFFTAAFFAAGLMVFLAALAAFFAGFFAATSRTSSSFP